MRVRLCVAAGLVVAFAGACGGGDSGSAGEASRTIEIDMVDSQFEPDTLEVAQGETVRFVFTNNGELAHDAFIGDADAQDEHEVEMREGHGHGGDDENALTVEPGDTGELTHTFDESGVIEIGCHQEGHYSGGMKINVEVT